MIIGDKGVTMKLRIGQTIKIGFAFLSICAFWQLYNSVVPLMLTNTFHMNETFSGAIMAADNVLALFLLPLFGGISDRSHFKMGKRKPFILVGTICAVFLMLMIPWIDNLYYAQPSHFKMGMFILVLGCLLVAMGTYRSPAVALMPDLTPKPFRSQGNAIINLMGAVGGILYLGIAAVMYSQKKTAGLAHVDYFPLFCVVAGIMIVSLIIVMLFVNEPKIRGEMAELEKEHPEWNLAVEDESGNESLPKPVKRSLIFLLISIALWFIGYNAVETWFTTFANRMWGMSLGSAATCLTVASLGAIVSYVPVGVIAEKIGRKKSIMIGICTLTACCLIGFIYTLFNPDGLAAPMYIMFAVFGASWAMINVNSLPMVLEMCKGSDVGKFTGYYYTFSMAAQIVTPIVAGFLMSHISYIALFPYAAIFIALAFITMTQVKHGDVKVKAKKGLEAFDVDD